MRSINFLKLVTHRRLIHLVNEFEVANIETHRVEAQDNGCRQRPLQDLADDRRDFRLSSLHLVDAVLDADQQLQHQEGHQDGLEVVVGLADLADLAPHQPVHDRVVDLRPHCEDEEPRRAEGMPFGVPLAGVDVGRASHQQHRPDQARHHRDLRPVRLDSEGRLPADRLQVEVVGHPAQHHQHRTRNCRHSEEDELWVVACAIADPAVGEGLLVAKQLREVVDDEESGNYHVGTDLEEDGGSELAYEHWLIYWIIQPDHILQALKPSIKTISSLPLIAGQAMEANCISELLHLSAMIRCYLQDLLAQICSSISIPTRLEASNLCLSKANISEGTGRRMKFLAINKIDESNAFQHILQSLSHLQQKTHQKRASPRNRRSTQPKRTEPELPEEQHLLRKLEKGLTKEYNNEENLLFETSTSLLSDSEPVKVENKLWKYFIGRMQTVKEKVEKERVNYCEKELMSIKEEVFKKITFHRAELALLQGTLKTKNQEIIGLFEDIKSQRIAQENINNQMRAKKRKSQEVPENNHAAKIAADKQRIEALRTDIAKAEENLQQHQHSLLKIQEEWKSFLRHFLRQGFYFQNGVVNILKEMLSINYKPVKDDFPPFLDDSQKRSLLIQYQRLKQQATIRKDKSKSFVKSTQVSESKETIRSLVKRENLLKIYDGTRSYMSDWLKNEVWKEEINLPRIQSTKQTISNEFDWRAEERRRLMFIDDKERYNKVRSILFGSKVETIT